MEGRREGRREGMVAGGKKPLSEGVCTTGHSPGSRPPFKGSFWVHIPGI